MFQAEGIASSIPGDANECGVSSIFGCSMRSGLNLFWPEINMNQSLLLGALLTWRPTRGREFRRYRKEGCEETGSHRVIENH